MLCPFLGQVQDRYPRGEVPCPAKVRGGQYLKFCGEYPSRCRADSQVSPSSGKRWSQMVTFSSTSFHALIEQTRLATTVLAVKHGVSSSVTNSLGILERYNDETIFYSSWGDGDLAMENVAGL